MNFFEQQDRVRQRSTLLVFYYSLGIALIVAAVNAAVHFFLNLDPSFMNRIPSSVYLWTSLITVAVILSGTVIGILQMSDGGAAVAKKLGARPVSPATEDANEKRLRNVVEEMAIASGITVPEIFIFNGEEINAFAAGTTPDSAAIAVSEGTLKRLNREELQGVIAHEFSHIFNGDMRLNIRLIGILNGIVMIAVIGQTLLRTRGRKNPLPLLGLLLVVIGYAGVFISRVIKSSISRQREFLADAAGVQFTRNPKGLLGALDKIRRGTSFVSHPKAEELSHLFFAQGFRSMLNGLFATHPPLEARIKAIDPTFQPSAAQRESSHAKAPAAPAAAFAGGTSAPITPTALTEAVASPTSSDVETAADVRAAIPAEIEARLHSPSEAVSVVYGLLSNGYEQAGVSLRLPILELAIPVLRLLPREEKAAFLQKVRALIRADNKTNPFEFVVEIVLQKNLLAEETNVGGGNLRQDAMNLLSYLAYAGSDNVGAAGTAFQNGFAELGAGTKAILPRDHCGPETARESLIRLAGASPMEKKMLVAAVTACVSSDGVVTSEEWELLRAICQCFGCPVPLLPPKKKFDTTSIHGRKT